ncbi:gluconokinase [Arsenicitalea aurantiaca]|uniref:Gluconokinase n=1 Tax=Arsenicitalea aurantiaca TaxID=1783274 RepID=A0A433XG99_9HYPH|nr:gluconokinase [Arsenicitalea aurantiaca]RUT33062.1 gluconokinase [Arsenicitalea aurantiaca]
MSTAPSPRPFEVSRIIIVMGVTSSGKSSIGEAIARHFDVPFLDGDQYHPDANVEKMRAGTPLTDEDRWPWLETLGTALHEAAEQKGRAIGACSALKRAYRDYLVEKAGEPILFVYLDGSRDLIASRMAKRQHHFMPTSLLDSQFATLERLQPDENHFSVSIEPSLREITETILAKIS